jgi:hypothetical protein
MQTGRDGNGSRSKQTLNLKSYESINELGPEGGEGDIELRSAADWEVRLEKIDESLIHSWRQSESGKWS